jgi:NitT/TauT family transport system substrate-binding protein
LLAALGGCGEPHAPSLRLGTFGNWPGYEPFYLARDQGFFGSTPVQLVDYASATQVQNAFRNGAIEAATLTLDEALQLAAQGFNPRVILVLDISLGADVLLADAAIGTMHDLKGKRVGVETTALGAFMFSRAIASGSLSREDVTVVPLTADEHERAFREGRVDALVTYEPMRTRLLKNGARILFDSSMIPGEVIDVLLVRNEVLDTRLEAVEALARGWFKALDYMKTQPEKATQNISARLKLSPDEMKEAFSLLTLADRDENRRFLLGKSPALVPLSEKLAAVMRQYKLLTRPVDAATLPDARAVEIATVSQ